MPGRPAMKVMEFPVQKKMDGLAQKAEMEGVYSVESLKNGIWYFCADNAIVVSTCNGLIWMKEETAETVAREVLGILDDMKKFREVGIRHGRKDGKDCE